MKLKIVYSLCLAGLVALAASAVRAMPSNHTTVVSSSSEQALSSLPELCAVRGEDMIPVRMTISFTNKYHRTESGYIDICLDHGEAPITVDNFLRYVHTGFYNHTTFHRIIAGFVDQGGAYGYKVTPEGYKYYHKIPKYHAIPLATTKRTGLSNVEGTIAMARASKPNSAQAQFYFNVEDNSQHLDYQSPKNPGYAVFGVVADTQSMQLLYDLSQVPVKKVRIHGIKQADFPQNPVLVESVVRVRAIR